MKDCNCIQLKIISGFGVIISLMVVVEAFLSLLK